MAFYKIDLGNTAAGLRLKVDEGLVDYLNHA